MIIVGLIVLAFILAIWQIRAGGLKGMLQGRGITSDRSLEGDYAWTSRGRRKQRAKADAQWDFENPQFQRGLKRREKDALAEFDASREKDRDDDD
jgi:hypothetical protein